MEEAAKKFREFLEAEQESGQSERRLVAEFVLDILDENGSADLIVAACDEIISAAKSVRIEARLAAKTITDSETT